MSTDMSFTKENLDIYLKELAKEYRKRGRGAHAEIILIGGASVLINYGFRDMTYDVDAIYMGSSVMKEAINAVGDRLGLPNGWVNMDCKRTDSYSPRLVEYATYYRTYSHVLEVRTIRAEHLVAMKLVSGRRYKKDMSDIVGILYEHARAGKPLSYGQIDKAMTELYDGWGRVDEYVKTVLMKALETSDLEAMFVKYREDELEANAAIREFEHKYPEDAKVFNANEILETVLARKRKNGNVKDGNT